MGGRRRRFQVVITLHCELAATDQPSFPEGSLLKTVEFGRFSLSVFALDRTVGIASLALLRT